MFFVVFLFCCQNLLFVQPSEPTSFACVHVPSKHRRGREREKPLYNKLKFVFFLYMYIIFSLYKEGVEKWFWKLRLVLH